MGRWEFTSNRRVVGVDECGVGPIAGPMFASAVLLREGVNDLDLVRDSKTLSEHQLAAAVRQVMQHAEAWSCQSVSVRPDIGLWPPKLLASCARAICSRYRSGAVIAIVDGTGALPLEYEHRRLVKGDSRCLEVACASVVGKYLRDERMHELDAIYPQYGFSRHKGYATPEHVAAIRAHGMTPEHRIGPTEKALATYASKAS